MLELSNILNGAYKMKEWLKTLTTKELKTWLRNMERYPLLNYFTDNGPSDEDLAIARTELKNRRVNGG